MMKHVSDIAEKYLIPGETQEMALMFVPSESVYAEIHDGFDDVVQKAYRARVVLVSPSLLMLAIQVMQQILKDARMREAADQIRTEVVNMGDDLGAPARARAEAAEAFWPGQRGRAADPDLRRQDRKARRRGSRNSISARPSAGRGAAHRQERRAELFPAAAQAAGGGVAVRSRMIREQRVLSGLARARSRQSTTTVFLMAPSSRMRNPNLLTPCMTASDASATDTRPRASWREALAVYLQPRVLIVLFLGFSSGLPLALSGSTLLVWMRESGVDLGTIGLFALVGTPYTIKFLWAPLVDALNVPC